MSSMITSPVGQQMADTSQQGVGGQSPPGQPTVQQATQQQQDAPADHAQAQDGRPVGTQQDAQNAQLAKNPNARIPATPQEQAQYIQLVTRFILMLHDMRPSGTGNPSPTEAALKQLNNPNLPIPAAVGQTTANLVFILHNMAKAHGVQYDPDVMLHAVDECVIATYLLGQAAHIFKGTPPYQGLQEGQAYPFTDGEQNLIGRAKFVAVQSFGKMMQQHGLISEEDRQQATQFWHTQIQHEVQNDYVDPAVIQRLVHSGALQRGASQDSAAPSAPAGNPADNAAPPPPPTPPAPPPPPPSQGVAPPTQPGAQ